ncbi:hypothetical protein [Geotalea toluenoxydans]|uniref:hypothetical protein n=1 Tax=Geotalea toluenoxydans TaxID=421624 RepID=UPI001FB2DA93|nr:hypothetical protein [Geotalea toluenoxydans]
MDTLVDNQAVTGNGLGMTFGATIVNTIECSLIDVLGMATGFDIAGGCIPIATMQPVQSDGMVAPQTRRASLSHDN